MLTQSKSRLVCCVLRSISSSSCYYANHYDVLGITPKATQGEIKTAYYKLSKIHHPDKSEDKESPNKFRAITEAYEVLSNIQLKKMYDKGLLVGRENTSRMDYKPEPEPLDPNLRFYKSRIRRHVVPTMEGRTSVYDFETWSKLHYGDLLKKTKYDQDFLKKKMENKEKMKKNANQEAMLFLIFTLSAIFILVVVQTQADYDQILILQKRNSDKLKVNENVDETPVES